MCNSPYRVAYHEERPIDITEFPRIKCPRCETHLDLDSDPISCPRCGWEDEFDD